MVAIIATICWCGYASMLGINEAIGFHNSRMNDKKVEQHHLFTIERTFIGAFFGFMMVDWSNLITLLNGLCLPFLFVMLHDGFYYVKRNQLDGSYPLGFWDMSTTSTSKLDKLNLTHPYLRLCYFIIGIVFLILINK